MLMFFVFVFLLFVRVNFSLLVNILHLSYQIIFFFATTSDDIFLATTNIFLQLILIFLLRPLRVFFLVHLIFFSPTKAGNIFFSTTTGNISSTTADDIFVYCNLHYFSYYKFILFLQLQVTIFLLQQMMIHSLQQRTGKKTNTKKKKREILLTQRLVFWINAFCHSLG